jgi:hypothetical protein
VYITDAEHHRVVKFNAEATTELGEFTYTPTPSEVTEGKKPLGVVFWDAVDPNTGNVYATNIGGGAVTEFTSSGVFVDQIREANVAGAPLHEGFAPSGVAVDSSGRVFVADFNNHVIDRFSSAGVYETQFADETAEALSIAVDTSSSVNSGDIYVTDLAGGILRAFDAAGAPVTPSGCSSNVIDSNGVLGVAVDPLDGAVIASEGTPNLVRYETPCSATPIKFAEGVFGQASKGIAVSATGTHKHDVYAVDNGGTTASLFVAEIGNEEKVKVITGGAENIGVATATVTGVVEPNGKEASEIVFEYGTHPFEEGVPAEHVVAASTTTATGSSPVPVHADLSGLSPHTEYHYRLAAKEGVTPVRGKEGKLKTLPLVEVATGAASAETAEGATLNGTVTLATEESASYYFEYGTEAGKLESKTAPVEVTGIGAHPAVISVSGLDANVVYHFRLVAAPASEPTELAIGSESEFKTLGAKPAVLNRPPKKVGRASVLLSGEIDTKNSTTEYFIEYGTTTAYDRKTEPVEMKAHAGAQPILPQAIGELSPSTIYHYRIIAKNGIGETVNGTGETVGPDATFTTTAPTPPTAVTGEALEITQTSAIVTGGIDPNGLPTRYVLETGTEAEGQVLYTPRYGEAGSGTEAVGLGFRLTGLLPGVTYHYRIAAINQDGTVYGADRTFTTLGFPAGIVAPPPVRIIPFTPSPETKHHPVKPKTKTRAQKLAKALKACKHKRGKQRSKCVKRAHRQYSSKKKG